MVGGFLRSGPVMKTAILIDGGHLRACAKAARITYDNDFIEGFARSCVDESEYLFRIFYYDSPQFRGKATLPVSGEQTTFKSNDSWLRDLAMREKFAVRRGTLGFRGWKPKKIPIQGREELSDQDFTPVLSKRAWICELGSISRLFRIKEPSTELFWFRQTLI